MRPSEGLTSVCESKELPTGLPSCTQTPPCLLVPLPLPLLLPRILPRRLQSCLMVVRICIVLFYSLLAMLSSGSALHFLGVYFLSVLNATKANDRQRSAYPAVSQTIQRHWTTTLCLRMSSTATRAQIRDKPVRRDNASGTLTSPTVIFEFLIRAFAGPRQCIFKG